MTTCHDGLRAGTPILLPLGRALLVIERTRMVVQDTGGWRGGFAQLEPCALVLRGADGSLSVLAAGVDPVSAAMLSKTVPHWERVLDALRSARSDSGEAERG